ncbi:MAG: hypothetical protein K8R92_04540 [Planctomycetes bacterium]|jgi:uncharacterized membrane protein|nr:hypothetical protein [Planctomycetota bacterium]
MTMFLVLRVLHILLAAVWVGATVSTTFFFVPAIKEAQAAGGQVMGNVMKRGYSMVMTSIAGLVMLTGLYLYHHYTQGFDPIISGSMGGRVFGTGGLAGILATVIASGIGRKARKAVALMQQAGPMPAGAEKSALMQQAAALQGSMATANKITLVLMVIAVVTMSVGHYVG